jgi:hypothetical protein
MVRDRRYAGRLVDGDDIVSPHQERRAGWRFTGCGHEYLVALGDALRVVSGATALNEDSPFGDCPDVGARSREHVA